MDKESISEVHKRSMGIKENQLQQEPDHTIAYKLHFSQIFSVFLVRHFQSKIYSSLTTKCHFALLMQSYYSKTATKLT